MLRKIVFVAVISSLPFAGAMAQTMTVNSQAATTASGSKPASFVERIGEMDIAMSMMQKEAEYNRALDQKSNNEMGLVGMPSVVEVFPLGTGLGAKLLYSSGLTKTVKEGQAISAYLTVSSISTGGVLLKKTGGKTGTKVIPLSFAVNSAIPVAGTPPVQSSASLPGFLSGLPPMSSPR